MVDDTTQSPEANLDRMIEDLIGKKLRGVLTADEEILLIELQSLRSRLMRPNPSSRRSTMAYRHYA